MLGTHHGERSFSFAFPVQLPVPYDLILSWLKGDTQRYQIAEMLALALIGARRRNANVMGAHLISWAFVPDDSSVVEPCDSIWGSDQ